MNIRVSNAKDVLGALREFVDAQAAFPVNSVNVAALFVAVARTSGLPPSRGSTRGAAETESETESETFAASAIERLTRRLREITPSASGRVCANVLHALGQLDSKEWFSKARRARVDETQWKAVVGGLVRRAGATAASMNAQELGNAYNGVSRLDWWAAAAMPDEGWVALSDGLVARAEAHARVARGEGNERLAFEKRSGSFEVLAAVLALNALASEKLRDASRVTSQSAFDALLSIVLLAKPGEDLKVRAVERLTEQGLANTLNACARLEKARIAVDAFPGGNGWRALTGRFPVLLPNANDQGVSVITHALTLCGSACRATIDEKGWSALAAAAARVASTCSPRAAAMLLNASWKLEQEPPNALTFGFSASTHETLGARAAALVVRDPGNESGFDAQAAFLVADALGKIPAAKLGFARKATERRAAASAAKDPWTILAKRLAASVVQTARLETASREPIGTEPGDGDYGGGWNERSCPSSGGSAATFHVLARVPELADALAPRKTWTDVSRAILSVVPTRDDEEICRILNGYAKLRRSGSVMAATHKATWRALGARVGDLARDGRIRSAHVATVLDALKKLKDVRGHLDAAAGSRKVSNPWFDLARVVVASCPALEPLQVTNVVSALGWLEPFAGALGEVERGWWSVLECVENNAEAIARGSNVVRGGETDESRVTESEPEAKKWMEKTAAGLELVRGHQGYATYGTELDRARLERLEKTFKENQRGRRR